MHLATHSRSFMRKETGEQVSTLFMSSPPWVRETARHFPAVSPVASAVLLPGFVKSSLSLPGLFSLPYVPNRLWQKCSELQKVNISSQSTEFWGSYALKAGKVLDCPDLESGCSRAGLPFGLLLQELRRRFLFFFFLTLDSYLTKWLSQPNLRAQHKTSSCLMAQTGVCEVASETCSLGDSLQELSCFHCPVLVEKDVPGS